VPPPGSPLPALPALVYYTQCSKHCDRIYPWDKTVHFPPPPHLFCNYFRHTANKLMQECIGLLIKYAPKKKTCTISKETIFLNRNAFFKYDKTFVLPAVLPIGRGSGSGPSAAREARRIQHPVARPQQHGFSNSPLQLNCVSRDRAIDHQLYSASHAGLATEYPGSQSRRSRGLGSAGAAGDPGRQPDARRDPAAPRHRQVGHRRARPGALPAATPLVTTYRATPKHSWGWKSLGGHLASETAVTAAELQVPFETQ